MTIEIIPNELSLSFLMTVSANKPTQDGSLGVFQVVPSDGLPNGVNLHDLTILQNSVWKVLYKAGSSTNPPAILFNGNTYVLNNGTWVCNTIIVGRSIYGKVNYDSPISVPYNTAWQAPSNGLIVIQLTGSYMNGVQFVRGLTAITLNTVLGIWGDDINSNTKAVSANYPVNGAEYYKLQLANIGTSGSSLFETILITFYPFI